MEIFTNINPLRAYLFQARSKHHKIGFVPTMGALHEGHLTLIQQALADNDEVVCSIYINPTQFNRAEDFRRYPRRIEADTALLQQAGCHVIFSPSDNTMYPHHTEHALKMDFGKLSQRLEGQFRPGHFNGVGLVVAKLFHIVAPHSAYFGQKDLQQIAIIQKMVDDLFFDINIVRVPTVRAASGLALSSRNALLSEEGLSKAANLFAALRMVKELLAKHPSQVKNAREQALHFLAEESAITVEYLEVVDTTSFGIVSDTNHHQNLAVCTAAYLEEVRLIDNILL